MDVFRWMGMFGPWFLYWMVAHFTMRTYVVNQAFRFYKAFGFIEDSSNPIFFSQKTYFASYVRNMFWATNLNQFHAVNWYLDLSHIEKSKQMHIDFKHWCWKSLIFIDREENLRVLRRRPNHLVEIMQTCGDFDTQMYIVIILDRSCYCLPWVPCKDNIW